MPLKHLLILLFIAIAHGSAFPFTKLVLNDSVPPILMASLRMGLVLAILIPFWKFKIPDKQYWLPLFCFSISMGFLANVFMTLSLNTAKIVSPIIIGSQLAIPFAILLSSIFLREKVSLKKWMLIFVSFIGVVLLGFDPLIRDEIFALILISFMALFYATAQVFSRYLKNLEVTLTNAVMGFIGFIFLIISSSIFEGEVMKEIQSISLQSWLLILHSGIFVSIGAHMLMFYLYRIYPVNIVFPFYALFPVFGVLLTFIIFYEIPTLITLIGGIIVIVATYFINKEK